MAIGEIIMINIHTEKGLFKGKLINDCEAFFKLYVRSFDFGELDEEVMKNIDNAVFIDKDGGVIKTPHGITLVTSLSTGCKVVLTYLHVVRNKEQFSEICIDVTECGWNALEELFRCADSFSNNDNVVFLLRHINGLYNCSERNFLINNKRSVTNLMFMGTSL